MFGFPYKLLTGVIGWMCTVSWFITEEVSNISSNDIILGIYEDYLDSDMAKEMYEKYQIKQDYLKHDQVVKQQFKSGVYGMATVSTSILEELINENLVEKIDWSKLGLKSGSTDISDANSAKDIFSDVVKKILESNSKFLEYGVPYFTHNLSFCYVGNEIDALKSKVTWSKLIEEITKDQRFKSKSGKPQLALIDDPRTVLSLARLVGGEDDVNKSPTYKNHSEIYADYRKLLEKNLNRKTMGDNFLLLDSTSSNLVDSLVTGDVKGAIMYNTDCLYASYGGNLSVSSSPDELHVVELDKSVIFLDFLTINTLLSQDKKERIYSFYKEVLMDGYSETTNILDKDTSSNYKHWLTRNFDYVKYTPVVKNLEEKICSSYFDDDTKKELRKKAIKVEFSNGSSDIKKNYESYFIEKVKSDMLIAFEKFKTQL